ncbi:efflux RND transporter permease subunit [Candidatus Uabimicrobium amorphum]|uniref:RND transporter n=1 Tax=Uabimicrobium amorphum TaxID=2596890 RepID=A0A5S9F1C8_UABAM|nr:efflux RND transporter permease subunit [Candidatus Uabimicrobium amorphum]BBM82477.1 RND transporter [Candidatus Uabimicrobium amorphum]
MNIPRFSLRYKTITLTATFFALLWGLTVYDTIPRNENPVIIIRTCLVTVPWPGASAEKVEQHITKPIERAVSKINSVSRIYSESRIGVAVIYVDVDQRIKDPKPIFAEVTKSIREITHLLPRDAYPPIVKSDFTELSVMLFALYSTSPGKEGNYQRLRKYAKEIERYLSNVPMIGKFTTTGIQNEVVNLEVSSGEWSKMDISVTELSLALNQKNIVAPGGSLDTGQQRYIVGLSGEFETTKQIEQVVIRTVQDKAPTYLPDLGIKVTRRFADPKSLYCRFTEDSFIGEECLIIGFNMKKGGNIVALGQRVREKLQEFLDKDILPEDIKLTIASDQPIHVEEALENFTSSLVQGIVVVVIVGFLMIGFRIALVMAMSIPIVMIISIGIFRLFGVELEDVSVAALIVSLGLLVDNAIEVSENIHRFLSEGKSRFESAWRGASEMSLPVLAATLTTVAAFLPMLTIPGNEGEYVYGLPVVVSTTLLVSWLVAMSVTTILGYWILRPAVVQGGILAFFVRCWISIVAFLTRIRTGQGQLFSFSKRLFGWIIGRNTMTGGDGGGHHDHDQEGIVKTRYTKLLRLCLNHRYITLTFGFGMCVLSITLMSMVGSQFFPMALRDQFIVDITVPEGASTERTHRTCEKVENIIKSLSHTNIKGEKVKRLKNMISFVGGSAPRFYLMFEPGPELHNVAQILVNTTEAVYTDSYVAELRELVDEQVSDARIIVRKLNMGTSAGAPVSLRLVGEDPQKIYAYEKEVAALLFSHPHITLLYNDWGNPVYQVNVNVNTELANMSGVTNQNVAETMNTFLDGQYLTTFREGDTNIPVFLRLPAKEREHLHSINDFYIRGNNGVVPIEGISQNKVTWETSTIVHYHQRRTLTIYAFVRARTLPNGIVTDIMPRLDEINARMKKDGCHLEIGGEWEETLKSEENFNVAFSISFILIIFILVCQYSGFAKTFMILLTLPMAFAGSMIGLIITGWPLNFMSQLGMISLAGMVLNDAIVLIDFIDRQLKESDLPVKEALVKAGRMRMIPILLTTFTTAGGLLPLSFWGGPLWTPMANVVIFGLMTATLLTLLLIPTVYLVLHQDFKIKMVK